MEERFLVAKVPAGFAFTAANLQAMYREYMRLARPLTVEEVKRLEKS